MNKVIMRLWASSNINGDIYPDGCSLHIDGENMDKYISDIYKTRNGIIPDEYDYIIGNPLTAFIDDLLYDKIINLGNIRLSETELNNIINLDEILIKEI